MIQRAVERTSKAIRDALGGAGTGLRATSSRVTAELQDIREQLSALGNDVVARRIDALFPTTSAPIHILHHGPQADAYTIRITLDDVLAKLDGGVLSRPGLTLHAGRSDLDRAELSSRVADAFLAAMQQHETRVRELASEAERTYRSRLDKSLSKVFDGAVEATFMHVVMVLMTGPLGLLILLSLGSFDRTIDAIRELLKIPGTLIRAGMETVASPRQQRRLDAAVATQRRMIDKALGTLELRMHRDLIALAGSYDNEARPIEGVRTSEALSVELQADIRELAGPYMPQRLQ